MSKKLVNIEVDAEFEVKNELNTEEVDNLEIITSVYTSQSTFCSWAEGWSLNKIVLKHVIDLDKQKRLDEEWKEWIANELEQLAKAVRKVEVTHNG